MSELTLTLLRLAFLVGLWLFVLFTVLALRRDLGAPREARPARLDLSGPEQERVRQPKSVKAPKQPKKSKNTVGTALLVEEGPLAGTVILLGTEQVTIGRAPDSTLIADDDYVSSRHARIYPSEGVWMVEDLGSTNGTWLDRSRITSPAVLNPGVPVRIGRTVVKLQA
jgi:pSer/pThr/pTyr-binding forkhead associated (FHA) protein